MSWNITTNVVKEAEAKLWVNCFRFYGKVIDGTYKSRCDLSRDGLMDVIITNGEVRIKYNDEISTPEDRNIRIDFNNLWVCLSDTMKTIIENKLIKNGYTKRTKYSGGIQFRVCPLAINGIAKLTYKGSTRNYLSFIQEYKSKNGQLIKEYTQVYDGKTELWSSTGWAFKYGSINAWNFPPITGGRKKYTRHRHRKIKRTYKV